MARRGGRRWVAVFLATLAPSLIVLGACSGDDDNAPADASTTTIAESPSTTTLPPATTTTTVPPLYSFDGSVPAPELVNMGDDYEAIFRSLDAYSTWLQAHNPDVNLLGEFAPIGSPTYTTYTNDLNTLTRFNRRYYDEISVLDSVELVDTAPTVATLRVVYSPGIRVVVEESGGVFDQEPYPGQTFVVLLSADETGRWRIASATPEAGETEL